MEPFHAGLITFGGLVAGAAVCAAVALCYKRRLRNHRKRAACSSVPSATTISVLSSPSGSSYSQKPKPSPKTGCKTPKAGSKSPKAGSKTPKAGSGSKSAEKKSEAPTSQSLPAKPPVTAATPQKQPETQDKTSSLVLSMTDGPSSIQSPLDPAALDRLQIDKFTHLGRAKDPCALPEGTLAREMHSFALVPRTSVPLARLRVDEIKGDALSYAPDFVGPRKNAVESAAFEGWRERIFKVHYRHMDCIMDPNKYQKKRSKSTKLPEPVPVEGNQNRQNEIEGTPFVEAVPFAGKIPARRGDISRHFLLNTQYATRLAFRLACASGRYTCIPSIGILDACGRTCLLLVANSDMAEGLSASAAAQPDLVYIEYVQIPESAVDAQREFAERPLVGRYALQLWPCVLGLSPNTFYPSESGSSSRSAPYTTTLTNSAPVNHSCTFFWDETQIVVKPNIGHLNAGGSISFELSPKQPVTDAALVAVMKYNVGGKEGALIVRFETDEARGLVQAANKALITCDPTQDPSCLLNP